jgi:hypothetical protein
MYQTSATPHEQPHTPKTSIWNQQTHLLHTTLPIYGDQMDNRPTCEPGALLLSCRDCCLLLPLAPADPAPHITAQLNNPAINIGATCVDRAPRNTNRQETANQATTWQLYEAPPAGQALCCCLVMITACFCCELQQTQPLTQQPS